MKRPSAARLFGLLFITAALLGLPGCAGMIIGAGAAAGTAAYSERGLGGSATDVKVHAAITSAYLEADDMLPVKIGVEVYDGRVLLTGVATDENMRAEAVRIAWETAGVTEVYNEIQLSGGGAMNLAHDSWITTQLKTKITFDKDIMAVNYSIETVDGVIYLIGVAQSQAELDKVIAHARTIDYVKDIIPHVEIKQAAS
jgi:osmotically-inducible protein OsmY